MTRLDIRKRRSIILRSLSVGGLTFIGYIAVLSIVGLAPTEMFIEFIYVLPIALIAGVAVGVREFDQKGKGDMGD